MRKLFIFVVAVAFAAACVMPAMAQEKEVSLYGSVRMETFARYWSKEVAERGGQLDRESTQFEIGDSSRFGARFKAGNTSANVELRPFGSATTGGSGTSDFRQWWGQVDFSGWQLRVGQQSVIDGLFPPGCCIDEGSVQSNFGGWSGRVRTPGLAAFIPIGNGTLKFGLFNQGRLAAGATGAGTNPNSPVNGFEADVDLQIPQIQASYDIKFGPAAVKFIAGYNTYKETYWDGVGATAAYKYNINSYVVGGQVESNFGPLTLMWQIHYAQNPSAYKGRNAVNIRQITVNPAFDAASNGIKDVTQLGSFLRLLYKMSDMVTWELGGGYADVKRDQTPDLEKIDDSNAFVYLNAQIFLTKTFRFTPEVGYFYLSSEETSATASVSQDGHQWYWGAYWRIDF